MPTVRSVKDNQFINTKYLPAAGATNNNDPFDLGAVAGDGDPNLFDVEVAVAAAPNHTDDTKTILIDLYDSANGTDFAEAVPLIRCKIPGVAVTGSAATTFKFRCPPAVRRYIRCLNTVPSGAGDNTGVLVTYSLLF